MPTAQALLDKAGRYDAISRRRDARRLAGRSSRARIKPLLPPRRQVKTADQQARTAAKRDQRRALSSSSTSCSRSAAIALFVGAFVIFNTLSITVAQRTREFATLRTLGASRRQVLRSVVLEALVDRPAARRSLGLLAGLGLAKGLNALFAALGIDLPKAGTVLAPRTVDRLAARSARS